MLVKWREFVEEVDPDVVIGYNIANFDLPYLMDRAKALKAQKFPYLGRMISACKLSYMSTLSALKATLVRQANCDEGHPLFVEGVRPARLERDRAGRPTSDRYTAVHATRVQAPQLHTQLCLRAIPRRAEGGCTSLSYHGTAEWYPRIETPTGGVLSEGCYSLHKARIWLLTTCIGCVPSTAADGQVDVLH